ncbi:MAG: YbaB/EbfC family nucleoid-associated protein [Rickettsiales bacterium]|nr:YbaB/EbfC family nucleoid-associated protein [Rickettsiales bacterium]
MDFKKIMEEADRLKKEFEQNQKAFKTKSFTASSGGGLVSVTIGGDGKFKDLVVDESLNSPMQIKVRDDLIIAAFNSAKEQFDVESKHLFSHITNNIGDMNDIKDIFNKND